MKLKSIITTIISTMLIATSCSTINSITGSNKSTTTQQSSANKSADKKKEGKTRGKRNRKSNNTTASRSTKTENAPTRPFTKTDSLAIIKQLAGEWTFDIVAGITVTGDEERPSLTFEENTNRFYASNGCNYFNGDYNVTSFNSLSFDNVISTLNLCNDIPWADYITACLNVASRFYLTSSGAEEHLEIRDSNNRTLATLKRHQLADLNGLWDVVEINGSTINGDNPTLVIDLLELTVHGNTGCNLFNGNIYQNPDVDRSIQFTNMAVTRMACPNTATETAFLVALEQTEQVEMQTPDKAILSDKSGRKLLKLQRTSL